MLLFALTINFCSAKKCRTDAIVVQAFSYGAIASDAGNRTRRGNRMLGL